LSYVTLIAVQITTTLLYSKSWASEKGICWLSNIFIIYPCTINGLHDLLYSQIIAQNIETMKCSKGSNGW